MRGRGVAQLVAWAQMPALLLTKRVTLGKSLNLSMPRFLNKIRIIIVPTSLVSCDD